MRVISGTAGGRRLKTLDGNATRPTADKVKEALFSIIQNYIPSATVLDLFAGSGSLGIEAVSRGAEKAVLVDKSRAALSVIRQNVSALSFEGSTEVFGMDALSFIENTDKLFDIIFIDPPYSAGLYSKVFEGILKHNVLKKGGILCIEYNNTVSFDLPKEYEVFKTRQYGSIFLMFAKTKEDEYGSGNLSGQL